MRISDESIGVTNCFNLWQYQFVAIPSTNNILKMDSSKSIDYTILKSMKERKLNYGVDFMVITPGSISEELYEMTISNFPACTCKGFRYMCSFALENPSKKWIL